MLESLFNPGAIAVIGASADARKVGHAVLNNLVKFKFKGSLYPVNPACGEILGLRAYARVTDIGQPVDLAIIVIPAKAVPASLRECVACGIRSAIVISAGFWEAGVGARFSKTN
jgi:acyl-CoA synthetase (NDP forming)